MRVCLFVGFFCCLIPRMGVVSVFGGWERFLGLFVFWCGFKKKRRVGLLVFFFPLEFRGFYASVVEIDASVG